MTQSELAARAAIGSAARRHDFAGIVRVMQAHRASVVVAGDACEAVYELLLHDKDKAGASEELVVERDKFTRAASPMVQALTDAGVVEAVCGALAEHGATDPSCAVTSFGGAVLSRCAGDSRQCLQRAGASGAIAACVAVMRAYARPPRHQLPEFFTPAVQALGNLMATAWHGALALEAGVVPVLFATLRNAKRETDAAADERTRKKWATLRRAAFSAFCNLVANWNAAAEPAGRMGAVEILLEMLREHAADANIMQAGLGTLKVVLLLYAAGGAAALEGGAVALVRAAQQAHRGCAGLQADAVSMLSFLKVGQRKMKLSAYTLRHDYAGIVDLMRTRFRDIAFTGTCLTALAFLFTEVKARTVAEQEAEIENAVSACVLEAITEAAHAHLPNASLVALAMNTVNTLLQLPCTSTNSTWLPPPDPVPLAARACAAGALNVIAAAMRRHATECDLQFHCAMTAMTLCREDSTRRALARSLGIVTRIRMARELDWGPIEENKEKGLLVNIPLLLLQSEPWEVASGETRTVEVDGRPSAPDGAERTWLAGPRNPERRFAAARSAAAIVALMREDAASGFAPYRAAVQAAGCRALAQLISPAVAAEYDEERRFWLLDRRCGAHSCPQAAISKDDDPRDVKVKLCVGCREVSYCSTACQHAHWADHKPACKAARVALAASSAHAAAAAQEALAAGALDAIVAALATHAADANVLLDGCAALALVVAKGQAATAAAAAAGAPAAVFAAFEDGTTALVKAAGCAAVAALAPALDAARTKSFRGVLQRACATHPACVQLHKRAAAARETLQSAAAGAAA